jgi:hypothetical protein
MGRKRGGSTQSTQRGHIDARQARFPTEATSNHVRVALRQAGRVPHQLPEPVGAYPNFFKGFLPIGTDAALIPTTLRILPAASNTLSVNVFFDAGSRVDYNVSIYGGPKPFRSSLNEFPIMNSTPLKEFGPVWTSISVC